MAEQSTPVKYEQVVQLPVSSLLHDPENPRLPPKFRAKKNEEAEVIDWMLHDASLLELIGAIAQVGYFPGEPLLVTPCDPASIGGPYYVVEGNRRFTAVELLLNPEKATIYKELIAKLSAEARQKEKLNFLPVIIYKQRREILDYLGYRHVTGIKEWGTFEKAEYLSQLSMATPYKDMLVDDQHKALARAIGSRADYVARLLTARALFQQAERDNLLGPLDLERLQSQFSLLTTALSYQNIASFVNLDPQDISLDGLSTPEFSQLLRWLYQPKGEATSKSVIGESRNLKKLSRVVNNPRAVAHLKQTDDLEGADQRSNTTDPTDSFRAQLGQIDTGLRVALEMVVGLENLDYSDQATVTSIDTKVGQLERTVKKATAPTA